MIMLCLSCSFSFAGENSDSLSNYLQLAAQNNPQLKASFEQYKASLEKLPQAAPFSDPEIEVSVFAKQMEIVGGKQVANFSVMQMFPWPGTRKAAKTEASEMARMSYDTFRQTRDNLFYQVKSGWYNLVNINEQCKTTEANIKLLNDLEQLAVNSLSASSTSMSAVLRIRMERTELENSLTDLIAARKTAEADFNVLLNRSQSERVDVPDSLTQRVFDSEDAAIVDSVLLNNPMITMMDAQSRAYRAQGEMQRKMSFPMLGIGLEYSLIKKSDHPIGMADMNGDDMFMPMLKFTLPIYRNKYKAQQRESRIYRVATELKKGNVRNELLSQYVTITEEKKSAARKIDLYTKQTALANETYKLVVQDFVSGIQPLSEVIMVERMLLDYKLKKSEAVAAYNTSIAALEKLMSYY